jgi:iron complex transport system substrate-binding protein
LFRRPPALLLRCATGVSLGALALSACRGTPPSEFQEQPPAHVVDDFGDTVPSRPYDRIVSLNPTTTEALFALGAGHRLVGRSTWDSWPPEASTVTDVGPAMRPNVEEVLAVRPGLVLLYASAGNRDAARQLRSAGVLTAAFRVDSIAHFMRLLPLLGTLVGDTAAARTVGESVRRSLDSVRIAGRGGDPPTVVMPTWHSPLIVIGGGSHLSELVEIAGGSNAYAHLPEPSPQVSFEDLLTRDPDVILVTPGGSRQIRADPRWRALRAVREGRVLELDTNVVGRPSVTLGAAAANIATLLHQSRR